MTRPNRPSATRSARAGQHAGPIAVRRDRDLAVDPVDRFETEPADAGDTDRRSMPERHDAEPVELEHGQRVDRTLDNDGATARPTRSSPEYAPMLGKIAAIQPRPFGSLVEHDPLAVDVDRLELDSPRHGFSRGPEPVHQHPGRRGRRYRPDPNPSGRKPSNQLGRKWTIGYPPGQTPAQVDAPRIVRLDRLCGVPDVRDSRIRTERRQRFDRPR